MTGDAKSRVRVVGFHGVVGARQTPARCAPIYVDDEGHFASPKGHTDANDPWEQSALRYDESAFPERGTRVEPTLEARPGWTWVVVGERERTHLDRLARSRPSALGRIVDALGGKLDQHARQVGGHVALYLSPQDATEAWVELTAAARRLLDDCCARGESAAIEDAAWWLKNAASDRDDVLRALAGLDRAGSRHVRSLAHAYFPERDINATLARIREVEQTLPARSSPQPEPRVWNGRLARAREREQRHARVAA